MILKSLEFGFSENLEKNKIEYELIDEHGTKNRKALRVFPAETRVTVYRRPRVFRSEK